MHPVAALELDRSTRHVRRTFLKVGDGSSRDRIAYCLEEALRLVSLPGEDEGRIYYFRCVRLNAIPANASRNDWIQQVEQIVVALAHRGVHAGDPSAASAEAVYFHHHQEALELLLRRAIRGGLQWEWFWSSMLGTSNQGSRTAPITAVLDYVRGQSIPPAAVATVILAAIATAGPVAMLEAMPEFAVRDWLRDLDRFAGNSADAPSAHLPEDLHNAVQQAGLHFGWNDLRTVWLASLAVLSVSPAAFSSGTVVKRARATLRPIEVASASRPKTGAQAITQGDITSNPGIQRSSHTIIFADDAMARPGAMHPPLPSAFYSSPVAHELPATDKPIGNVASSGLLGEATNAAGFFFLLNVLRHVRLPAALETWPVLAEAGFVTHIMRALAACAGVADSDPVLACLDSAPAKLQLPDDMLLTLSSEARAWPANLLPSKRARLDSKYLLRSWIFAVRLWCWRAGRITLRDVILRRGHLWLTCTDLDVTLPLLDADIRIRRIGLDIDPGWLPWFGSFGRVVRFHYRDLAPGGPAC